MRGYAESSESSRSRYGGAREDKVCARIAVSDCV